MIERPHVHTCTCECDEWEQVHSCWGIVGQEWAEQSAKEALNDFEAE